MATKKKAKKKRKKRQKAPTRSPPKKVMTRFCEALADHGVVRYAAEDAGIDHTTAYKWRKRNAEFAEAWDAALEMSTQKLERVAFERAAEGWDEPVFYNGIECGAKRRFSDTLAIFLLKARRPEVYRERHEITHSGEVTNTVLYLPRTSRRGGDGGGGGG
jgi:hypothetical protein